MEENQDFYREKLQDLMDNHGIKLQWISDEMYWSYANLCKFKNGQVNVSERRLQSLKNFLKSKRLWDKTEPPLVRETHTINGVTYVKEYRR